MYVIMQSTQTELVFNDHDGSKIMSHLFVRNNLNYVAEEIQDPYR